MKTSIEISPGLQRLFQDDAGRCVLLHKAGIAVSFYLKADQTVQVVERLEGIDFKATGARLKQAGWQCTGPGMTYAWLLENKSR